MEQPLAYPLQKTLMESEPGKTPGDEEMEMGWMMLFWVLLIVAVPTILMFLLAEKRRNHR